MIMLIDTKTLEERHEKLFNQRAQLFALVNKVEGQMEEIRILLGLEKKKQEETEGVTQEDAEAVGTEAAQQLIDELQPA
jgi:hypothetical protein